MKGKRFLQRGCAAVIGGSLAGLLAARVLSEHFGRVVVLERDPSRARYSPRRGTPQAAHSHVLLNGGQKLIEGLFPGIGDDLCAHGARRLDFASDLHFFHHGAWRLRFPSRLLGTLQSRALLELQISERIRQRGNVEILDHASVRRLLPGDSGDAIGGLEFVRQNGSRGAPRRLATDLVVDASGRGSRVPAWLEALGHPAPREDRIEIDLGYASRLVRPPDGFRPPWKALLVYPKPPAQRRAGFLVSLEGNRWLVTVAGYDGDHPGATDDEFREFCRELPSRSVYDAMRSAEPLSGIQTYRFRRQVWRRYDLLPRQPRSLILIGDSICSLNPLFGQGMSLSASEAVILGECLTAAAHHGSWHRFAGDYYRKLRRLLADPWLLSGVEAARFRPDAVPWTPTRAALEWYSSRVFERCSHDRLVCERFLEVFHLTERLGAITHPGMVARVLLGRALGYTDAARPIERDQS